MIQQNKVLSLASAVRMISDGDVIAIGGNAGRRHPLALVREIMRQRKKNLHITGIGNDMAVELLVRAGCVSKVETSRMAEDRSDAPTALRRLAKQRNVDIVEHGEAAAIARFSAGAAGIPCMPLEPGTDSGSPHVRPFADPFTGKQALAIASIRPQVAIMHAHAADRNGNVQLDADSLEGNALDITIARSARTVIVSVEQVVSEDAIRRRPLATSLSGAQVACVVEAPYGAYPGGCDARYGQDPVALEEYRRAVASASDFKIWCQFNVHGPAAHDAFLDQIGAKRLLSVTTRLASRS